MPKQQKPFKASPDASFFPVIGLVMKEEEKEGRENKSGVSGASERERESERRFSSVCLPNLPLSS